MRGGVGPERQARHELAVVVRLAPDPRRWPPQHRPAERHLEVLDGLARYRVDHLLVELQVPRRRRPSVLGEQVGWSSPGVGAPAGAVDSSSTTSRYSRAEAGCGGLDRFPRDPGSPGSPTTVANAAPASGPWRTRGAVGAAAPVVSRHPTSAAGVGTGRAGGGGAPTDVPVAGAQLAAQRLRSVRILRARRRAPCCSSAWESEAMRSGSGTSSTSAVLVTQSCANSRLNISSRGGLPVETEAGEHPQDRPAVLRPSARSKGAGWVRPRAPGPPGGCRSRSGCSGSPSRWRTAHDEPPRRAASRSAATPCSSRSTARPQRRPAGWRPTCPRRRAGRSSGSRTSPTGCSGCRRRSPIPSRCPVRSSPPGWSRRGSRTAAVGHRAGHRDDRS